MLQCRLCNTFISQQAADRAAEIVGEGHETMCEACALALAEAEAQDEAEAEAE
ncbi:MAG TPA: hypothetical protein VFA26_00655 [Gemmataceae bacterium]|nr:hypothetical protein [Gemmataceae bacterium]